MDINRIQKPKKNDSQARRIQSELQHGFDDPYQWMEKDSAELDQWVAEQSHYAAEKLSHLPRQKSIRKRLAELIESNDFTAPIVRQNRYFFQEQNASQELPVLCIQEGMDGKPRVLIDPTLLSPDQTTALADVFPSRDGTLLAYRLSEAGSSLMSLHVMDVTTGQMEPAVVPAQYNAVAHIWYSKNQVCWSPDNSGFFYTRRPLSVPPGEERYHQKLYYHRLGECFEDDELIFGEKLSKEQTPFPQLSGDGRYLLVAVQDLSEADPTTAIHVCDLKNQNRKFFCIVPGNRAFFTAHLHQDKVYLETREGAPCGKLNVVSLGRLEEGGTEGKTLIPEQEHSIGAWTVAGKKIIVETLENVSSRLRLYDLSGHFIKEIQLPTVCSIEEIHAAPEGDELFYALSSFVAPKSIYRVDLKTHDCSLFRQKDVPFDGSAFEVVQEWYPSQDQTQIPMFLVHKKGLKRHSNNPTLLFGYGGFNHSKMPTFQEHIIPFLEQGGVYALASIRGGGEFGEKWHEAGMRENKQNVFSDFIAAAEWLVAEGVTNPSKLGCYGRSNGGLLVNTVAVQRPDLWKAVVSGSPVIDMARFHLSHAGKNWIAEYGSPEDANDLQFLMKYSPYHNLPSEINAPSILMLVPKGDDRVAPWHGRKMLAAWQHASTSGNPILLHSEEKAGHKGGASGRRTIERFSDMWSFLFWQLDVL